MWLLWWVASHTLALVMGGLPHTGSCGLPHTVAFVVGGLPDITHCGCCGQLLKAVASRDCWPWGEEGGSFFFGFQMTYIILMTDLTPVCRFQKRSAR